MRRSSPYYLARMRGLLAALLLGTTVALAVPVDFEPYIGQDGKDVVWVPTPQPVVDAMLDLAKVKRGDVLIDLGAGDGRTVITAALRGARAIGVEFNPDMVVLARRNAERAGVAQRVEFRQGDLFQTDLAPATVITMFLLPELNVKLRPRLLQLPPGTRIVTNTFRMGNWKPDASRSVRNCDEYCMAHLWIVPARIEGSWQTPAGVLKTRQRYQFFSGTLGEARFADGRIDGDTVRFTVGDVRYVARWTRDRLEGEARGRDAATPWSASRLASQ